MSTWLEVALNGPWTADRQPRAPRSVETIIEEGIACAEEGAAIVHVHAFDPDTGRQKDDWEVYARIIEGIRARVDAIVYPTIPFPGAASDPDAMDGAARFSHIAALAERGLLEWAVVDPGSTYIADAEGLASGQDGFLYANPPDHVRAGLALAAQYRFHPGYAIYEPGFTRQGAAFAHAVPDCPTPIYRFMFSDAFLFGFPPSVDALDAHRALLSREAPDAPWMVAGLRVDITPLIGPAVARAGHVRVGLEDAPWGSDRSNIDWVRAAAREITGAGGNLATVEEVRGTL